MKFSFCQDFSKISLEILCCTSFGKIGEIIYIWNQDKFKIYLRIINNIHS